MPPETATSRRGCVIFASMEPIGTKGVDLPWNLRVDQVNLRNTAANKNAMLKINIHDVKWFYFTNP